MSKHRSMRGEPIDLQKLAAESEKSITVGNTKTNARGDVLGKGGKVVKSAESVAREHYNKNNPKAVKVTGLGGDEIKKQIEDDWDEPVIEEKEAPKKTAPKSKPAPKADATKEESKKDEEWVEDADGNFVRKEDNNEN